MTLHLYACCNLSYFLFFFVFCRFTSFDGMLLYILLLLVFFLCAKTSSNTYCRRFGLVILSVCIYCTCECVNWIEYATAEHISYPPSSFVSKHLLILQTHRVRWYCFHVCTQVFSNTECTIVHSALPFWYVHDEQLHWHKHPINCAHKKKEE